MRVSIRRLKKRNWRQVMNLHVSVDGVFLVDCVAADSRQGWARVFRRDGDGRIILSHDMNAEATVTVRGQVRFHQDGRTWK